MAFNKNTIKVPQALQTESFLLRSIRASDAALDYDAVMESRDFLRLWEQSDWPEDDFTLEANRRDLERHEKLHADGKSFTYTVMNHTETICLGCVYLFPIDAPMFTRSLILAISDSRWQDMSAAVYFWIRKSRLAEALDRRLLDALLLWLEEDWGFEAPVVVTNAQFEQQVAMIENADLPLLFRVQDPKAEGEVRAYGATRFTPC